MGSDLLSLDWLLSALVFMSPASLETSAVSVGSSSIGNTICELQSCAFSYTFTVGVLRLQVAVVEAVGHGHQSSPGKATPERPRLHVNTRHACTAKNM